MAKFLIGAIFFAIALTAPSQIRAQEAAPFWTPTNGPHGGYVYDFVQDADGRIFAGTSRGGLFRSDDDGRTWHYVGLRGMHVVTLALDADGVLYASGYGCGLYRSSDGGQSMERVTIEQNSVGPGDPLIFDIDILGTDTLIITSRTGTFLSTDRGSSWIDLPAPFGATDYVILGSEGRIHLFYGSVLFRSVDSGQSWTETRIGPSDTYARAYANDSTGILFVGTNHGVFRSSDGGESWAESGLSDQLVEGLAVGLTGLFATTHNGIVYESRDRGETWHPVGNQLSPTDLHGGDLHATQAGTVLIGWSGNGPYRLEAGATDWVPSSNGIMATSPRDLVAGDAGELWAPLLDRVAVTRDYGETWSYFKSPAWGAKTVALHPDGRAFLATQRGLYVKADNAFDWEPAGLDTSNVHDVHVSSSGRIYASTVWPIGVFRSHDGSAWEDISASLIAASSTLPLSAIRSIVEDAAGNLYAANYDDVFRSDNRGDSWIRLGGGVPPDGGFLSSLEVDSFGDVYLLMTNGVFRWNTTSLQWMAIMSDPQVSAIEATTRGKLFIGMFDQILASADSGTSWEMLDSGMPEGIWISNIEEGADGTLYVAGGGIGVYRSTRLENVVIDRDSRGAKSHEFAVYPNPFSATTTLSLSLDGFDPVRIAAYDMLGREVDVLYDGAGHNGVATVTWTPTGIAAGLYYIRIRHDGVTDSRSVVYLK